MAAFEGNCLSLQSGNLLKKRLRQWCFSVNFAKLLRTLLLKNTSGRLLYKFYTKTHHEKNISCSFDNILSKSYTKEENINKALRSTKFRILLDCRSFCVLLSHYEKSTYTNSLWDLLTFCYQPFSEPFKCA